MPQTQRQPVPFKPSKTQTIEVITETPRSDRIIDINTDARQVQEMSSGSNFRFFRRWFFIWFRVYVKETKYGKSEKVNVSIPLPIPIVGATFARHLSLQKAARLANEARRGEIDLDEALESTMGFEFVRVHEANPERGKSSLVVVGFD
ncbi:MAG: hypothetical protein IT331_01695 [Anaerolineae bacterium]|nr:hypothetical protein [Anaerolineae bacterium]